MFWLCYSREQMRLLLGLVAACWFMHAADWPRFRGPNGFGVGENTALPAEFNPSKNVIWKTALPPGHSSPILSGDHIFLTAFEGQKLFTIGLDRATGKILWRTESPRTYFDPVDKRNSPASPSPVSDGKNIYVFFPDFGLLSYDFAGKERWRVPLGPFHNVYGMGASPIVVEGKVILACDQSYGSFVAAYGKDDGKLRWKTPRAEALSGHSTPALYQPKQGPAQLIVPGSFRMDAYSIETGESVWWVYGLSSEMKSLPLIDGDTVYINGYSSPENDPGRQVFIPPFEDVLAARDTDKDGQISKAEADERTRQMFLFIDLNSDGKVDAAEWKTYRAMMATENGLLAFRAGGHGNVTETSLLWKYQRAIPQLPSLLLYENVMYMINDSGVLTTLDPSTGAVLKQGRLRGVADHFYSSPVAADGKIFFVSEAGIVTVLKAGGQQEVLAVNELDDQCAATPAIADGRIYIRTRSALYAFGK